MRLPNSPIVNAGLLYYNGLALDFLVVPSVPVTSYVAGKAFIVQPGQARDSTNTNDIFLPQAYVNGAPYVLNGIPVGAVVNGLEVGANGVDLAPIVANSLYAVYVIGSSSSVYTSNSELGGGPLNFLPPIQPPYFSPANPFPGAILLSLSSNAVPVLPYGYDMYRRIGWVATNASALFLPFGQECAACDYVYPAPLALAATAASVTYVKMPLINPSSPNQPYVPLVPGVVDLAVTFTAGTGGDVVNFLPYGVFPGSYEGAGMAELGASTSVQYISVSYGIDTADYSSPTPVVLYKTTSAGDTLVVSIVGFSDIACC